MLYNTHLHIHPEVFIQILGHLKTYSSGTFSLKQIQKILIKCKKAKELLIPAARITSVNIWCIFFSDSCTHTDLIKYFESQDVFSFYPIFLFNTFPCHKNYFRTLLNFWITHCASYVN